MRAKADSSEVFVDVAVPTPVLKTFTYRVSSPVVPGCRVFVPFGSRHLVGMAVRLHGDSPREGLKKVREVLDEKPILSSVLLELGSWMSAYYLAPPWDSLRVMLPPGLLVRKSARENLAEGSWPAKKLQAVVEVRPVEGLTGRQRELTEELGRRTLPVPVQSFLREVRASFSVLQALSSKGAVRIDRVEINRSPWEGKLEDTGIQRHRLTGEQEEVFTRIRERLDEGRPRSLLIHGVTGSGKTELYLNAISEVRQRGRSALVLVPEIGLTPQIARSFRAWFSEEVAILHSGLSDGERFDEWRRIRNGQAGVVVGTRSAVFAPLPSLGIIVVDEEHDSSYKQEESPRYNARDVARKRASLENALVLLGSATPQMETFHAALSRGDPECLTLNSRVLERPLAEVRVVDMREEFQRLGKAAVLSVLLEDLIRDRLSRKEQVLILLNRRGYAAALLCRSCGATEVCEHCSISLTYHQESNRLICHYCGHSRRVPVRCGQCGKPYIHFLGHGTEQIQEIIQRLFPAAVVDRLDRDSVQRKGSLEGILEAFSRGRTDVLVGTQMIAKGHDFPQVTLVGVLGADQGLRLADFRSAERTFQLLTQVAGRAGRGTQPGKVVIQTYYPNHYSLKYARLQDYRRFFAEELKFRRRFRYPPFSALANLKVRGSSREKALGFSRTLAESILRQRSRLSSERRMRILGPAQAPLERLKGEYRFQILIKTTSRSELHEVLEAVLEDLSSQSAVLTSTTVDIDPIDLM